MLDLTLQKELYKIKWIDGAILQLKPPTQRQYLQIQAIQNAQEYTDIIYSVYDTTSEIINNNANRVVVDNVAELGLDTCLLVLKDYFEFYSKQMQENVVFQHTQQQNQM